MELSQEIQTILQKYRPQSASKYTNEEYINVDNMEFDDETWLVPSKPVPNLSKFFTPEWDMTQSNDSAIANDGCKQFDSRTFTRPKRKLHRPSIEKYNQELYADTCTSLTPKTKSTLGDEIDQYISMSTTTFEDGMPERTSTLHFDLTQPVSTSIFENIAHAGELDSFQNMSPPSLVNSMCSSAFTNLMDNSYIKNDPVLREIRDADYSSVIYQEIEPPLYQSITESCSSITTEIAETFVRKTLNSLNCTFNKQEHAKVENDDSVHHNFSLHSENIDPNTTYSALNALNGTYKKNKSIGHVNNITFVSEQDMPNNQLNTTFQMGQNRQTQSKINTQSDKLPTKIVNIDDWNTCMTIQDETTCKKKDNHEIFDECLSNTTYSKKEKDTLNRLDPKIDNYMIHEATFEKKTRKLSDEIDEFLTQSFYSNKEENALTEVSAKSTDSLDRLSSISNCSHDSKLMAEVDAIVERQERSLQQVVSTPKPTKSLSKIFEQVHLSPIPNLNLKEHLSDSEVSSGEYNTVRTRFSDQLTAKSLSNLKQSDQSHKKSIHTLTDAQRTASGLRRPSTAGGLRKESKISGSYGNLKRISSNLGSSYTNLRPRSMILPNVSARPDGDATKQYEEFKVPSVPVKPRETNTGTCTNLTDTFVKPKMTSLPRPISGTNIPRPASRIPGPRVSRLPLSRAKTSSKTNLHDGLY